MNKCPPEIHGRIFFFACLDDGSTGRSLSQVSRYIRDVSYPYQWQSLHLLDSRRVANFAELTTKQVNGLRRPIYHLFVRDGDDDNDGVYCEGRSSMTQEDTHPRHTYHNPLHEILQYASRTLDTLTFFSSTRNYAKASEALSRLLALDYPALSELTIRSLCTPFQLETEMASLQLFPKTIPNLERLHLAIPCQGFSENNLNRLQEIVHALSSNVTHLRISLLDRWGSRRVAEVIHAELASLGVVPSVIDLFPIDNMSKSGPQEARAPYVTWERLLPQSLKAFVLQPSPTINFYCSCCMEYRGDLDVMRLFEKLSEVAEGNLFTFIEQGLGNVELANSGYGTGYALEEAMRDWMERINEHGGCWQRRDNQEILVPKMHDIKASLPPPLPSKSSPPPKAKRSSLFVAGARKLFSKLKH